VDGLWKDAYGAMFIELVSRPLAAASSPSTCCAPPHCSDVIWRQPSFPTAAILVSRHLKTTDDLFDNRSSSRTESMVAVAVQWAERIMKKINNVFGEQQCRRR
jgi:hypothetical protein